MKWFAVSNLLPYLRCVVRDFDKRNYSHPEDIEIRKIRSSPIGVGGEYWGMHLTGALFQLTMNINVH